MNMNSLILPWKRAKYKYLEGMRFGRLTIICAYRIENQKVFILTKCRCGKETIKRLDSLTSGGTISCGCFQKETVSKLCKLLKTTHGMKGTKVYTAYLDAKTRCNNKNRDCYKNYGGRGIKFLFNSFEEFYKEVGDPPTENHSIDRKNNNGNYEVNNLKWSTRLEQNNNKRNTIK